MLKKEKSFLIDNIINTPPQTFMNQMVQKKEHRIFQLFLL